MLFNLFCSHFGRRVWSVGDLLPQQGDWDYGRAITVGAQRYLRSRVSEQLAS
jgi:hypothetical protein